MHRKVLFSVPVGKAGKTALLKERTVEAVPADDFRVLSAATRAAFLLSSVLVDVVRGHGRPSVLGGEKSFFLVRILPVLLSSLPLFLFSWTRFLIKGTPQKKETSGLRPPIRPLVMGRLPGMAVYLSLPFGRLIK